jgi:hypothetical protein
MNDDEHDDVDDDGDGEATNDRPERDALSRLVELLAEERIIQPSLADFLR